MIDHLHQTHTLPEDSDRTSGGLEPDDLEGQIAVVHTKFGSCSGLTDEQLATADHWQRIAVEGGHLGGVQDYAGRHWGERKSLEFLEAAWLDGFSPVLWQIAVYYRSFNPKIYGIVSQDRVTAYAYSFLSWKLFELRWSRKDMDMESLRIDQEARLERHANALREPELRNALQLAKSILRQNENCCYEL